MAGGRIFGTSSEVQSLAKVIQVCMEAIEQTNQSGNKMLMFVDGSQSDALYRQCEEIVKFVEIAIQKGQEPLETVTACLNQYAAFLESHGK